MDTLLDGFHGFMNGFDVESRRIRDPVTNGFKVDHGFLDPVPLPSDSQNHCDSTHCSSLSSECNSPGNEDNLPILRYISDMLMEEEEDLKNKPCMLQDCLALQAAEKSLYDALGQTYPSSPNQSHRLLLQNRENPDDDSLSFSNDSSNGSSGTSDSVRDEEFLSCHDLFWRESVGNFKRGILEGSKFFPEGKIFNFIDLEQNREDLSLNHSRGKRSHHRENSNHLEEGRNSKQSAIYADESEPPEIFDQVLLYGQSCEFHHSKQSKGSRHKSSRSRKQDNSREVVDLSTLLIQCAQAVAVYDQRTAKELLKQIRQNSSAFGDGTQRLAHYFANGLETRLAAGTVLYTPLADNGMSAAEILKGYQVYITACPFKRLSNSFANRTILKLSEKATALHIIDFGVLYGFQWPCLIQRLSSRPGGPPKLRITCIELPQPGFRPAERVEETGRRLANYCKRFNVPFEYKVIAQKWETIKLEDLEVDRNELNIVNCMFRLKNIPDETVLINSPRDTVLRLIKDVNPDLFVHGVVNGTYSAPFFLTRFKEALFHFSALFDMFEATVPGEDHHRYMFEKGVFGRDAVNTIACEGLERVERPETYKQWQVRNMRAGFRQIPLDQEILVTIKNVLKSVYHGNFVVDVDGHWMLQGWKGRIIHALSFWVPA